MQRRSISIFLIVFALFATAAATVVGIVRVQKITDISDSFERRIARDGTIFETIGTGNNRLCLRTINREGFVTGYYPLPESSEEDSYTAYHTIGYLDNELYLYTYETRVNTPERNGESIVAYDMTNGLSRVVTDELSYGESGKYDVFFAPNTSGDALFLGYLERESKYLTLTRIDAKSGAKEDLSAVKADLNLFAISVAETGDLFALSQDSCVRMLSGDEWICLFEPAPREAAANMTSGLNGEIYLFTASPDGTRALVSTPENRNFIPMDIDTDGLIKLHIGTPDRWVALNEGNDEDNNNAVSYVVFFDGVKTVIRKLEASFWVIWDSSSLLVVISSALIAAILFMSIRAVVKKRRLYLLTKLLLILIPLFLTGIFTLVLLSGRSVGNAVEKGARDSLLEFAYEIAQEIDEECFAQINWNEPFEDERYKNLSTALTKASEYRKVPVWNGKSSEYHDVFTSCWLYRIEDGRVYTAVCGNYVTGLEVKFFEHSPYTAARNIMMDIKMPVITDIDGSVTAIRWKAVLYPILADDLMIGYLEIARPMTAIEGDIRSVIKIIGAAGLAVFAAVVTAVVIVLTLSTKTLAKLKRGALAVSGGDYSARVETKSWDETGEIAAAFSRMAESVETSVRDITEVSDGYKRFVPDKLIGLLGKSSISGLRPGDHKSLTATHILLFTDSFDKLRNKEFFDALGRFYNLVIPCIASVDGLISHYSPRGLAAIFENPPEVTLCAILALFASLDRAGGPECHVFLSYSEAMLGVTGNEERLNMITVSRLVYESYSVGMAGKRFGTRLIVPQSFFVEMGQAVGRYNHRFLGFLRDEGRLHSLYDFYDSDSAQIKVKKDSTRERFENGVKLYYDKEYSKARRVFVDILKEFPEDTASREFLRRSHAGHESGGEPRPLIELR